MWTVCQARMKLVISNDLGKPPNVAALKYVYSGGTVGSEDFSD
jgi:hypothetical protein